eukprot:439904-Amphidinium_carterae.2
MKRTNSKSIAAMEEEMRKEKRKQQKKEKNIVRMKLDAILDDRVDLVPEILKFAERCSAKTPKPLVLSEDEGEADIAVAEAECKSKGKKRDKDKVDPASQLEKWQSFRQTSFARLRSEEICFILQELNPITFTPANLASLRHIRGQRVIPKDRLLECLEVVSAISGDEPIVPPFFTDFQSVVNYAVKKHEALGHRSESLTMPPRDIDNKWWVDQGLCILSVADGMSAVTVTHRFSSETYVLDSDGTWTPTTTFCVMNNHSHNQAVLARDGNVPLQTLSSFFEVTGKRKESSPEDSEFKPAPITPAGQRRKMQPKAPSTTKTCMATKRSLLCVPRGPAEGPVTPTIKSLSEPKDGDDRENSAEASPAEESEEEAVPEEGAPSAPEWSERDFQP